MKSKAWGLAASGRHRPHHPLAQFASDTPVWEDSAYAMTNSTGPVMPVGPASAWCRSTEGCCASKAPSLPFAEGPGGDLTRSQVGAQQLTWVLTDGPWEVPSSLSLIRCHTWGGWVSSVYKTTWLPQWKNSFMLGMKKEKDLKASSRGVGRTLCRLRHLKAHVKQTLDRDLCEGNRGLCSHCCSSIWGNRTKQL